MLLHLLHFLLNGRVQLVLELERRHMIHVPIAVEKVALQRGPRPLLGVAGRPRLVFVVPIAAVPRAAVRLPRPKAHPAKVRFAVLILAHHVIAAAVLLDRHVAFGTLFRVRRDPVARLRVVVALLDPLLQQVTFDGIVPVLAARETERVIALARDAVRLDVLHFDGVTAIGRRTPSQQSITLRGRKRREILVKLFVLQTIHGTLR